MSEILVADLDEAIVEQLESRARNSGRSLQAELKAYPGAGSPVCVGAALAGGVPLARRIRSAPLSATGLRPIVPTCWPRTGRGECRRGITGDSPPSSLVVDASVVIKWHVAEIHADAALRLLADDAPALHVPDLMFPEVGNILWKKIRRGDLTEEQARRIAHLVAVAPLEVHRSAPLLEAALEIAMRTGRTVYDSLYVALAVQMDCRLVTADERLYNALKDGPLGAHILWVEDDLGIPTVGDDESFDVTGLAGPYSADEIELVYSFFTGDRLADADLTQLVGLADLRELVSTEPQDH